MKGNILLKFIAVFFSIFYVLTLGSCKEDIIPPGTSPGDTLWVYELQNPDDIHFVSSPLAEGQDGTIYFAAGGNGAGGTDYELQRIYALNNTDGSLKWKSETLETWHINSYILIGDDGTIYVNSGHKLYALNASDGTFKWTWEPPQNLPGPEGYDVYTYAELGPLALTSDGGIVTVTSESGSYYRAVYHIKSDGTNDWHRFTYSTTAGEPFTVGKNGTIYKNDLLGSNNYYSITALNPSTGELLWSTPSYISEAANNIITSANDDLIVFTASDTISVINHLNGQIIKKTVVDSRTSKIKVCDKNDYLYLYNPYEKCSIIDILSGNTTANSLDLPQHPVIDDKNQLYGVISDWHPHLSVTDNNANIIWESKFDIDGNSTMVSNNVVYMISGNYLYALQADGNISNYGWARFSHDNRNTFNAAK